MGQSTTAKPFKNVDLVFTIEERLRASKSIGLNRLPSHHRGLYSEWLVYRHYERLGFKMRAHREATPFAEIDLLFIKPDQHYVLVEVKSVGALAFHSFRLGKTQLARLLRARLFLESRLRKLVELHLALVDGAGRVQVHDDFLC